MNAVVECRRVYGRSVCLHFTMSKLDEDSSDIDILQSELDDIIKQLDNFRPEPKRKVGRPKNNPTAPSTETSVTSSNTPSNTGDNLTLTPVLSNICSLTQKIITHLAALDKDNKELKSKLLATDQQHVPRTSQNTSGDNLPKEGISYATIAAGPRVTNRKEINDIDARLDKIEQESLNATLKLDGDVIKGRLAETSTTEESQHKDLTRLLVADINKTAPGILTHSNITNINIIGKQKKHIKLKLDSSETKLQLMKIFKEKKPDNFFISQYLTKNRTRSFYRLKNIKKANNNISSVYCYSGNICCKLSSIKNHIFYLNSQEQIDKFLQEHDLKEIPNGP